MARPRSVDRERLLDIAERLAAASGAAALTFGSIAAAAGVPKATLQSAFGSKEALISAMLDRWLAAERKRYDRAAGRDPDHRQRVRAHLQTTFEEPPHESSRVANLMAALASSGSQADFMTDWYRSRMGEILENDKGNPCHRIAFLAGEGAYFMRHMAGYNMSEELWNNILNDLLRLIDKKEP